MKKIFFFLFLCLSLFLSSPVFADCNPPADYSSCPISQLGPKIAGNIDPRNYQQIREQYNYYNPNLVNQQIPVTVIYTTADLSPENRENTLNNLREMQRYGLYPIIRISSSVIGAQGWNPITPQEAQTAAQTLNQILSQIHFSQKPTVYFGNEPNLPSEWGGNADAQAFAQAFAAFIQSAGPNRPFQIFVPPIAGHQGGAEYNFLQQILNYRLPSGQTIAQSVDGAALTVYNSNTQTLSYLYQQFTSFYQQNGITNFVISEIGPLVNGHLLQNINEIGQWASIMSQVFHDIQTNPNLFPNAQIICTSFFLDTDKPPDGFPDVTLLVVIDANGNVIIMQLTSLGGGILKPPTYGECQADEPFKGGPLTKGDSFSLKVLSCFGSPQDPAEAISALIKTIELDFPQNQKIATHLHENTLKRLNPFNFHPVIQKKSALGKITYEVCEEGTSNWFNVEREIEFKTPEWMKEMANTGEELAKMLFPFSTGGFSMKNESLIAITSKKSEKVLGEETENNSSFLAQAHSYSMNISPQISPQGGNNYSVCWSFQAQADCGLFDLSGTLSVSVGGKTAYSSFWGPVATSFPYQCTYSPFPGPISLTANPGENISICVSVTNLNHHCGKEDPRPHLSGCASCLIGPKGEILNCGGAPIPTPTPRMCESYSSKGEKLIPQVVCVAGQCFLKDKAVNPSYSFLNQLLQAGLTLSQALQQIFLQFTFPLCQEKTYIITPQIQTPYTWEPDQYLRNEVFSIFKVPNNDTQEAFKFKHALQNSTQQTQASPLQQYSSLVEIFGQAGVKNSYDWIQKALLP